MGSVPVISGVEQKINSGKTYMLNKYWTDISDGEDLTLAIEAPSDKYLHIPIIIPMTTGSIAKLQIHRGASITANGESEITNIPNLNNDDNAPESGVTAYYDVTFDNEGEKLYSPSDKLFGSNTNRKQGPLEALNIEINTVVQPDDMIILKATNIFGGKFDYMGLSVVWNELDKGYEER